MPAPYSGGCQCGEVRYELTAEPLTVYCCHCTECQAQSSSGFGMSMVMPRAAYRITRGTPKQWTRKSDSGNDIVCSFCPTCGSRLTHESPARPDTINVKPGSLDDKSWLRPVGNCWTRSAQPWIKFDPEMVNVETQDMAAMMAAYAALHGA